MSIMPTLSDLLLTASGRRGQENSNNEMNKEQMIEHWMDIARAVFRAEDEISKDWFPRLRAAKKDMPSDKRRQLADDYLRAIATEILENGGMAFEDEKAD